MPPLHKHSIPGGHTNLNSKAKTSSRPPQFSDIVRQKLQPPVKDKVQRSHDKQKLKSPFPKERKTNEKDELVRHMSNLPAYLQKVEKRENFQDKALNFGVLDWNLLEKWKYPYSGLPDGKTDVASSSSSRHKRVPPQSCSSRPYPTKEKGLSQDIDLSRRIIQKEFENSLRSTINEPENNSRIKSDKGMRREIDRIVVSEKESSLSGYRKIDIPYSGKDVMSAPRKVISSRVELPQSPECFGKESFPNDEKAPVLNLSKQFSKSHCHDIVNTHEPKSSNDGKSKEANDKETLSSRVSSKDVHFEPLLRSNSPIQTVPPIQKCVDTRTPNSNPLRANEVDTPSRRFSFSLGKIRRSLSFKDDTAFQNSSTPPVTVKSRPIRSEPSHRSLSDEFHSCPLPIGSTTNDKHSTTKLGTLTSVEKMPKKQSNENLKGPNELDAVQSRYSSPNRRFGVSLGKMKRSLSFKEGLNTPQLALNENQDSLPSKSRSSPLRRLLDPILKTRVTHPCPSSETSSSLKQNPILFSKNEFLNDGKPEESTVQALLQVTTKNGLPLFKLVVNNSSDILVAMKNITPVGKFDVDSIYTFYSVHEIKKKSSSWINQVHKEKCHGFGYNVVGQMKGFKRFCAESSLNNFEKDRYTQNEFVLYSVGRKQGDGEAPELVPHRELASIIVKVPFERNIGKELTGKEFLEYLEEDKFLFGRGESEKFHSTTVILSGADHGLPKDGVPSSLIQRWRSGGSCDCGGWDVGCKLQILTKSNEFNSNREHLDLSNQEGSHDNKPKFKLAPFKRGIYSIEFSSSISLLQALSTCIAAISSRQSFYLSEINNLSDGKLNEESTFLACSRIDIPLKAQEISGKYVPSPPPSPVGRV